MQHAYAEARKNQVDFGGLQYTPKAELNLSLGMILAAGTAFLSTPLAVGLVALSCANYFMNEKPEQDRLVEKYYEIVGPSGYRNGGGVVRYNTDPALQEIFKGLTHPFFRSSSNEPQDSSIIDNAAATRMFTKK